MSAELIGILGVGVALAVLIWRVHSNLDSKITSQGSTLDSKTTAAADAHASLAREFSELRGEIRARFAIEDAHQSKELVDALAKRVFQKAQL